MDAGFTQPNLFETILRAREVAQVRLCRFSNADRKNCRETYLLNQDHFCGIRFDLGPFRAMWKIEESQIKFFRGQTALGSVELMPGEALATPRRAA
ncbi:MAG: hypothetical protein AAF939_02320 [Planctomycetota bacterium]